MFSSSIIFFPVVIFPFTLQLIVYIWLSPPVISLGGSSGVPPVPEFLQIIFFVCDFNPLRGSFPSNSFNKLNPSSCNIYFTTVFVVYAFSWENLLKCRSYGMFSAISRC